MPDSIPQPTDKTLPGRARRAAETLVETWMALGRPLEDYDLVWRAKEYLLEAADRFQDGGDA